MSAGPSEAAVTLLVAAVEALRDLAGALIDNMPPDAQDQITDVQVRLLQAVGAYKAALPPPPDRANLPDEVG